MSRAGYYAAQRMLRQPQKPCVVRVLLKSEFETSDRNYCCRRLKSPVKPGYLLLPIFEYEITGCI